MHLHTLSVWEIPPILPTTFPELQILHIRGAVFYPLRLRHFLERHQSTLQRVVLFIPLGDPSEVLLPRWEVEDIHTYQVFHK